MASELDKFSQYYISKGNTPRAKFYADLAAEERAKGTPETLGEQVNPLRRDSSSLEVSPEGRYTVRFASPEQSLQMQEQGKDAWFFTQLIQNMQLMGNRKYGKSIFNPQQVTVREGELITRKESYFARKKDMYELEIRVSPEHEIFPLPSGHELFCRMTIDGVNKVFETKLKVASEEDDFFGHHHWESQDPNDKRVYSFFASPNNTELLSKLSFSLYTKPQEL